MKTAALTIAFALLSIPAAAQSIDYVYTTFDAKKCKHTPGKEEEDYQPKLDAELHEQGLSACKAGDAISVHSATSAGSDAGE